MQPHHTSSPTIMNWIFDSGVSFHATNDLSNLSIHVSYDGTEELVFGYGSCLQISHIGSMNSHTPHTPLILKHVLYFPSLSQNIISISRLCIDNQLLIEFYSFFCHWGPCIQNPPLQGHISQRGCMNFVLLWHPKFFPCITPLHPHGITYFSILKPKSWSNYLHLFV